MAKAHKRGANDYIFLQPGSRNYFVRLRDEKGCRFVQSLGTSDREQAVILALPKIAEHKARLLAARPRFDTVWKQRYAPRLQPYDGPNDEKIVASERELTFYNAAGEFLRTEPNGGRALQQVRDGENVGQANWRLHAAFRNDDGTSRFDARPTVVKKDGDDALLETYLRFNSIDGLREKQARNIWHVFKTVVNKPIAKCTRDDGRAIVAHLEKEAGGADEIKSATLRRRMVPLVATVNLAIAEGKLTFNPFASCVPDRDDEEERDAFSDDDMKLIRANLHKLDANDQLLVRILATTGVRREEAFEIDREEKENGIRFVTIGADKGVAKRRVPFPKDLLQHLPDKIAAQLITGRMDTAGKRLSAWLTDIGVIKEDDERNLAPMHSFRHRAAQRMRAAGIPEDVREALGGWAGGKKKKQSRKYGNKHGAGYPLKVLKKAIDTIGF